MSKWLLLLVSICTLSACAQKGKIAPTALTHYAPLKAQEISLPKSLREISGLATMKEEGNTLYAEQDEDGIVYTVDTRTGAVALYSTIDRKGDFEDIAHSPGVFWLLRSDGTLFSFPDTRSFSSAEIAEYKDLLPVAEYEGLCYMAPDKSLYALAKTIPNDNQHIYVYRLAVNGQQATKGKRISLSLKEIGKRCGEKFRHFRPSAISFNEIDKQWFILSSVNHILLVFNTDWKLVEYCSLSSAQYPQPEGMAFDTQGNLWLSSEAGNQKKGKLYKIVRN